MKINSLFRFTLLIFMAFLLSSCYQISLTDISHKKKSREIIGDRYEVVGKVHAYGVRMGSYSDPASLIEITTGATSAGPEIEFSHVILEGSIVEVLGVMKSNDIPFFSCRRELVVSINDESMPTGLPIYIPMFSESKGKNCLTLNEKYFKKVKDGKDDKK